MFRSLSPRLPRRISTLSSQLPLRPARCRHLLPSRPLSTTAQPPQREPTELDHVTRLPNGLRIASEALPGPFSGVGVFIDAGSRYEDNSTRGISHIMDRLAFRATQRHDGDKMLERMELLGGNIQCASSREAMMYQAATFNSGVEDALALLAETVREPRLDEQIIKEQCETAEYELDEIWGKPELILPELVHTAAFKDNTLGNPLLCPKERLPFMDVNSVQRYRDLFYRPERMVVAFAGVDHDKAVKMTEKFFGDMVVAESPLQSRRGSETSLESGPSSTASEASDSSQWSQMSSASNLSPKSPQSSIMSKIPFFKSLSTSAPSRASVSDPIFAEDIFRKSHYTGGFLALPLQEPNPNPQLPNFSHIHLAFEGLPITSDDIYALTTLQFLLGGGGSFSAGGPGKGMYSRLYTNVLNQHAWVESCVGFSHTYSDSGLFGISASCVPGKTAQMLDVMCRELRALTLDSGFSALKEQEVDRAKKQLRSSLLMNLESRMTELEDLGRQVQIHGRKVPVKEMCEKIDALTVRDLRRVAKTVLGGDVPGGGSGAPTVVLQEAPATVFRSAQLDWAQVSSTIRGWRLGR